MVGGISLQNYSFTSLHLVIAQILNYAYTTKLNTRVLPELRCCDVGHDAMVSLSPVDQTKH
jgi:hypothetical protein